MVLDPLFLEIYFLFRAFRTVPGLKTFWKYHKSKDRKILPGSYTTIFSQLSFFIEKKLMFKPEKPGFSLIFLTVSKEINRTVRKSIENQ